MADLTITINSVSPEETRAAQYALQVENNARTARGLAPFPNPQAFIVDRINTWLLPKWIHEERAANEAISKIKERWKIATDAQRAAALAALPEPANE